MVIAALLEKYNRQFAIVCWQDKKMGRLMGQSQLGELSR